MRRNVDSIDDALWVVEDGCAVCLIGVLDDRMTERWID